MLFEHSLCLMHSRKTNLWSCKSTNRGFLTAIFHFWIYGRASWHCNHYTSHFKMVAPVNSKVKNRLQKTSICGLTRPKIQIHVSDISCVQRAFWAQPVETVEVPFKSELTFTKRKRLMTLIRSHAGVDDPAWLGKLVNFFVYIYGSLHPATGMKLALCCTRLKNSNN